MLLTLFCLPIVISIILEFRFLNIGNEFQIYSLAVCIGVFLVLSAFWTTLWVIALTHYKHRFHPLVMNRFGFLFMSLKNQNDILL